MSFGSFLGAAALAALASAAAAGTFDAASTGRGTATSEPMPLAEGQVIVHVATDYSGFETGDPDSPMASASGPCFGSVLIDRGRVSGGGHCIYTDADGDSWIAEWAADGISADGRTQGAWRIVAGTGKWDGASGGGRFDAGADDAGAYTNRVTGAFTTP